jgi:hypothetical protein
MMPAPRCKHEIDAGNLLAKHTISIVKGEVCMNEQVRSILDRREATLSEMIEHSKTMRRFLELKDSGWVFELEKYYAARDTLLEADKELSSILRNLNAAA